MFDQSFQCQLEVLSFSYPNDCEWMSEQASEYKRLKTSTMVRKKNENKTQRKKIEKECFNESEKTKRDPGGVSGFQPHKVQPKIKIKLTSLL